MCVCVCAGGKGCVQEVVLAFYLFEKEHLEPGEVSLRVAEEPARFVDLHRGHAVSVAVAVFAVARGLAIFPGLGRGHAPQLGELQHALLPVLADQVGLAVVKVLPHRRPGVLRCGAPAQ